MDFLVEATAQSEHVLRKPLHYCRTFDARGDFRALNEAQAWLKSNGYSYGSLQAHAPIGVAFGDCAISKWRNLGRDARNLDGAIVSLDFRNGPVSVLLVDAPVSK